MNFKRKLNLKEKVIHAAEDILQLTGSVTMLSVFTKMRWVDTTQLEHWRQGLRPTLEENMQSTPEKRRQVLEIFTHWAHGLHTIEAPWVFYSQMGPDSSLKVFKNETAKEGQELAQHYLSKDLSSRKKITLQKKLNEKPEVKIFVKDNKEKQLCAQCQQAIDYEGYFYGELHQNFCLKCLQLDQLVFLPSGDAALSRRAKKYSKKFAAVVEYNSKRKRYERRGLLIEKKALDAAELECANDAGTRAQTREKSAIRRDKEDFNFTDEFTQKIKELFPNCPTEEVSAIAEHATERGSGRVGRTAAAKQLNEENIKLAVIAYIRHKHTFYDRLLLNRTPKKTCRKLIQPTLQKKLKSWEA